MRNIKTFAEKVKRGLRQLWYRDIWHFWPTAPLNWRYILPGQSSKIRLHRKLWWNSRYKLPGLLWLPMELVRWVYWQLWVGPRKVTEATTNYGPGVEVRFGISMAEQKSQLSYWSTSWCINPYVGYDWRLYQQGVDGLAIIYESETSAYHAMQNRKTGATKANHRLLGDKIALAEKLSTLGIPMVATTIISSGDWHDVLSALRLQVCVFCKLRSGNQGESAFAVWQGEQGLSGQALTGKQLPDEAALKQAWQTLSAKGAVLIQPLLANHPALASVVADDVAITLRVVTRAVQGSISAWWAELQVPGEISSVGGRGSWRVAVSVADGAVSAMNREWFLKQDWQDEYDTLLQRFSAMKEVPHWEQICDHSLNAHQALPKVWAIAWDWVITPTGPVLLEGNGGWGLEQAQQQLGGFANPP